MKINRLSYCNKRTGWNLDNLMLKDLNLLVGASGVGKTQILRAILSLKKIAGGKSINGAEWTVEFNHNGKEYRWDGKFDAVETSDDLILDADSPKVTFVKERLICDGEVLIERTTDSLLYKGEKTVKLDASASALKLLNEEEPIRPVYEAFEHVYELGNDYMGVRILPYLVEESDKFDSKAKISKIRNLSPIAKLYLLKQHVPDSFNKIREDFIQLFNNVEDIDFALGAFFNGKTFPILRIKERGVDCWIPQNDISAGMRRCLSEIISLHLADDGDVILVDEFENSLGVNCIDVMADSILYPEADIQFIITSHHPYIINSIPSTAWKIVTRNGSEVKTSDAGDLGIDIHSKHDAFMQLMQKDAFTQGVSEAR